MMQNSTKNSFLIFTNIIVVLATIYSLVETEAGNRNINYFVFPNQVPLTAVNQISSNTLPVKHQTTSEPEAEVIASIKHYQYVKDNLTIDASIFYVVNTRGNVKQLIETQTNIAQDTLNEQQIKKSQNRGFYSLFRDRDRAYLSTCLNPQGITSVTAQQFSHNLNQVKITPSLLGKWLVGKASIRDRRCLWMHLSIPLQSEVSTSYDILENTWLDLVEWWIPNFPQL